MLEEISGKRSTIVFSDGFLVTFNSIDPLIKIRTTLRVLTEHSSIIACLLAYAMHRARSKDKMLQRCEDTHLCLNWEKSHFMVKEGIVLGHKISKNGIEVDKAKVDVIAKLPHPTTVKGVRSFLGHAGKVKRLSLTNQVLILQSQKHKLELEKNKAEAKAALLKAQPSFPNVEQLKELLVKSLKTEFLNILSTHDFSSSLPTELKELPSKFDELIEEVKWLKKQVHEFEIELPGDLKEIPTKLKESLVKLMRSSLDFYMKFYNSLGRAHNRCSSSIGKTQGVVIVHSKNRLGRLDHNLTEF
ncbi:hypothetical protein Tco_0773065 [Tanacetum coccineum]|uniref:Reverse transcriptase domain-containing protein n=1 Tax=Tanacetum coccineum TaxID=301880 RepID=A0ABQ4ZJN5_9ASTR